MPEGGALVQLLVSPLSLIDMIALAAGSLAYPFAAADLKNTTGRERLRAALQAGGHWRRLYIHLLTPVLDRLDRFLGDLALVYPILSLFFVWVWTGESGKIGNQLWMKSWASGWLSSTSVTFAIMICLVFLWNLYFSG